jgi:DNA-directed RNA polymerase specialized sigma24 family protein
MADETPAAPEGYGRLRALLKHAREGSEEAARVIVEDYGKYILDAVRRKLTQEMRALFDSIDFQQSVWRDFFADRDQIPEFSDPKAFIGYLEALAHNKTVDEFRRRYDGQKRLLAMEVPLNQLIGDPEFEAKLAQGVDTPSEIAAAHELMQQFEQRRLSKDDLTQLRRQGLTQDNLARLCGISQRTVRRILRYVEERRRA